MIYKQISQPVEADLFVLLYIQNQSLQILALGVVDIDRVVGWLGELVQDAYLSASDCRS